MSLKRLSLQLISAVLIIMAVVVLFERVTKVATLYYGQSDFFTLYNSVLFYFSGQDIYSPILTRLGPLVYLKASTNLNAPFLILLSLPFHLFNYAQAFEIWSMILTACVFMGGYLVLRPFPQWHKYTLPLLLLFLLYFPNLESLFYGEASPILLVVVVVAWLFAREHKDNRAGIFIGLACTLKLFCGLFLIYFLCLKRFRLLLSAFLTLIVTSLLGALAFGFSSYASYYRTLKGVFWYATTWNVSLNGFFMRLLSNVEHNVPLVIAPHLSHVLTLVCSGLLMLYLIWAWCKQEAHAFDRGFSLVLVAMLLLSPLAWIYYFPLLVIPYLVIVSEKNDWVHLAACILLAFSTNVPRLLFPSAIKATSQVLWAGGVGFYVLLGLLVLLAKPYPEYRRFAPKLWSVIYTLIFLPSLLLMIISFFSLTF